MDNIFYYCSYENFIKITESKALWLTPVQLMNDCTEIDYLYKTIWPEVKDNILSNINGEQLIFVKENIDLVDHNSGLYILQKPYCACFSDNGDLLAQFCRYADDGKGLSIGFNPSFFHILSSAPTPNSILGKSVGFGTVVYDHSTQISILKEVCNQILFENPRNYQAWLSILKALIYYSALFKHSSFFTEQEKRIIYYFDDLHNSQFSKGFISGPFKYKTTNNRYEISWYKGKNDHAISKIFLGPKCSHNQKEVIDLLSSNGINIELSQLHLSSTPYR